MSEQSEVAADERGVSDDRSSHFKIFTVLWVVAAWFHIWNQVPWPKLVWWSPEPQQWVMDTLLLLGVLGVLRRPGRAKPFLFFLCIEALHGLIDMPRMANHWYISLLVALVMLGSAVAVSRRDGRLTEAAWFEHFAPGARSVVWVAYAFAAMAKLNKDFLDPGVSCASTTWVKMGEETFHWLPQGWFWEVNAIATTVVVELMVPLVLLLGPWRHVGILIALAFHYLISLPPQLHVPDFASMLFAWWWLYLPSDVAGRMRAKWVELRKLFPIVAGDRSLVLLGPIVFIPVLWYLYGPSNDPVSNMLFGVRLMAFGLYGAMWLIAVILCLRDEDGRVVERPDVHRVRHPWHVALVVVALLTGMSPYLGLRTTTNFTMFSNLRTEGHQQNHLFLPQLYLLDHQNELVEVVASSGRKMNAVKERNALITWWELRYLVSKDPDASLTFARDGKVQTVPRVGDHAELSVAPSWLERRLLSYRLVDKGTASTCQW